MIEATRAWWERTFAERQLALARALGPSHPPGGEPGHVIPLGWSRMEIPGACCMVIPPTAPGDRVRCPHEQWVYVSVGLTQPVDPDHLHALRESESPTSYDAEFAILTRRPCDWAPPLLQQVMWYVRARRPLGVGDRLPMRFEQASNGVAIEALLGDTSEPGCRPRGPMRALLVWPLLAGRRRPRTSIGAFEVRLLTTITQPEWDLARRLGPEELVRRLDAAGVARCAEVDRPGEEE